MILVVQLYFMNIVSDTNTFLAVVLEEPERESIIKLSAGNEAIAPEILYYEAGNALSAMVKRKQLTHEEALEAQKLIDLIPVRLLNVDIRESLKIALEFNIYTYDAYFLQCAINHSSPLLTLDKRMKQVAKELNIQLIEVT